MRASGRALAFALALCGLAAAAAPPLQLQASSREPRVYGYQVGDVLQREFTIDVPAGLVLDPASLPRPGGRGQAIELRTVRLSSKSMPGGQRQQLQLDYQVFLAPKEVRTLEIAPISLRYSGQPREQQLRIDALPVTVAPLLPLAVSPRQGLGEMQPDVAPPLIDAAPLRRRLAIWAALVGAGLAWLAALRLAWPWWQRRRLPFGRAWAGLRRLPDAPDEAAWRQACRSLHQALNESAGQVMFEAGLAGWAAQVPAYAPLQADLTQFLQRSRQAFFAPGGRALHDGAWLRALCRRCCDVERGA